MDEPETGPVPFSPWHHTAWNVLNATTAPVWLAMILAPNAELTRRLVGRIDVVLAGLGLTYVGLLATGVATGPRQRIDVRDPDSLRAGLTRPEAFLAGWTHYLAFDLLAGRWIWQEATAAKRSARLSLLLTWWLGPAGVTVHLARRRRWGR